jgi:hypothetical protein
MVADFDKPTVRARVEQALDELFAQVLVWGGVITGEHGIGLAKKTVVAGGDERSRARSPCPAQADARSARYSEPWKICWLTG